MDSRPVLERQSPGFACHCAAAAATSISLAAAAEHNVIQEDSTLSLPPVLMSS
jgi:hypothetical protein